jgi:hypothetical protein
MSEWQPNSKRKLAPEEKRAPREVPWRFDRAETFAGIVVVLVLLVVGGWCVRALTRTYEIGWREDGIIVEVFGPQQTPRPDVTSVTSRAESFPWALQPSNTGSGPCKDPRFRIAGMPERGRRYSAADELPITLEYDAPGCTDIQVEFRGEYGGGSSWYETKCNELPRVAEGDADCPFESVSGEVFSRPQRLSSASGRVTLIADPVVTPTPGPPSPPEIKLPTTVPRVPATVDGMKLCSIRIRVTDGVPSGSTSEQEVHVDCEEANDFNVP